MHKTWRIFAFLASTASFAQTGPPVKRGDNSDWWSLTRSAETNIPRISEDREPSKSNFQILELEVNDDALSKATANLGKTSIVQRGDASAGRSQVCYTSLGEPKTHLIFEKGEVNDALYLFNLGPDWNGSELCSVSDRVTTNLSTKSGLHLGQTAAEVKTVLGKPSVETRRKIIYSFVVEKKSTPADLENQKGQNPKLSDEEIRRDYGSYTLTAYIECRFTNGKLSYLAISKAESF
jgi:hypothetical protein